MIPLISLSTRRSRIFALMLISVVSAAAQTADNYAGYSVSNGTLAAYAVTEGSMNGGMGITHTYKASVTVSGPNAYASSPTQSTTAGAFSHASVRADVSLPIASGGLYTITPIGSAICSEVGPFWYSNNSGIQVPLMDPALQNLFNQSGIVQNSVLNADGTVTVTVNAYADAMIDMWQCGCTTHAPPIGNPLIYPSVVIRLAQVSLKSLWQWYITNKLPSPTGTWPGYNPNSPNAPGYEPNGQGDYEKHNPDGSTDKIHADLGDSKHGPHWDYNHYPAPGQTGAYGGRIYPDPSSTGGIFVHN
jgi:hypothetical protein